MVPERDLSPPESTLLTYEMALGMRDDKYLSKKERETICNLWLDASKILTTQERRLLWLRATGAGSFLKQNLGYY